MLYKQNKPADTRVALEVVSSLAVVFNPFVIKIRHDDGVRRGLTSSRLNMVDCKFPINKVQPVLIFHFFQCSDITNGRVIKMLRRQAFKISRTAGIPQEKTKPVPDRALLCLT